MKLRPYQKQAVENIFCEWKDKASTILVLPTGTGKTVCFAHVIQQAKQRAMVVVHREELANQAKDKIERVTGLEVGVEMGLRKVEHSLFSEQSYPPVVVASVQTLCSAGRINKFNPFEFGLVIFDEAHHAVSSSWRKVFTHFSQNPNCKFLGVTATPDRADDIALGHVFESVAMDYEIVDAINDGWLVPIEQQLITVDGLDFSQIHTVAGDLNQGELAKVMEDERKLHQIASPTMEIIGDKRAMVFCVSVKQAEDLTEIFNRHKPHSAEFVSGETPKDDRARILRHFKSGNIQILCNCAVFTEGFDDDGLEVVVVARPTKSRALYAQMVGRGTRPLAGTVDGLWDAEARKASIESSGKRSCLVLDFEGNSGRHKLMSTFDILGGDGEIMDIAKQYVRNGRMNTREAIEKAREELEEQRRKKALVASLHRITMRAKYSAQKVDAFNGETRDWTVSQSYEYRLTSKQKAILVKAGFKPEEMAPPEARQTLNEIFRRWDNGLCSIKQANLLKKYGYSGDITKVEASKIIDQLSANGWRL